MRCFPLLLFDIPEETIDISLNLCDKVDMSNIKVNVEPNNIEYEHETIDDILTIKNEVYKRRLLKTLCVGASMRMANGYEYFENELNEFSDKYNVEGVEFELQKNNV